MSPIIRTGRFSKLKSSEHLNCVGAQSRNMVDHCDRSLMADTKKPYLGLTKLLVLKLALPHLCLYTLVVLYCVCGAFVFQHLERSHSIQTSERISKSINHTSHRVVWKLRNLSTRDELEWKSRGRVTMNEFVGEIYRMYKHLNHSHVDHEVYDKWAFGRSFFFSTTTLTSIGYGNQTPSTRSGKIFCIFYALFGLPLMVVTMADIAKFISPCIHWAYLKYLVLEWNLKLRIQTCSHDATKYRRGGLPSQIGHGILPKHDSGDEEMAEFVWVNLTNLEIVETPPTLIFALIVCYVSLGAAYFRHVEEWTFFEGFYFSLISILAIGFGDYTPKNEKYIYASLLYVVCGIVLTTTCIDTVGIDYINKMHFWGRQLNKVDPLQWLKDVQKRRMHNMKKKAMVALFNTLTALHYMRLDPTLVQNMKPLMIEDQQTDGFGPSMISLSKQASKSEDHSQIHEISNAIGNSKIDQKSPPSAPRNFRAINISVHCVTLKWDAPISGLTEDTYYSISYRLRSVCDYFLRQQPVLDWSITAIDDYELENPTVISSRCMSRSESIGSCHRLAPKRAGITGIDRIPSCSTSFTVSGLKSFALYQFTLVAVNKIGRSRSVHTQEYTEPSTVPLNIRALSVTDTTATIAWDPPARNKLGPRRYTLHVTSDANRPFHEWHRSESFNGETTSELRNLDPMTSYVICVSANHNRGLATFSRSMQLCTLARNPLRTDENMNANLHIDPIVISHCDWIDS